MTTSSSSSAPFEPRGCVAVVTGAAGGIGAALVRELGTSGASVVVAADLDGEHMARVADVLDRELPDTTVVGSALDVSDGVATGELIDRIEELHGGIDLWCANAGIGTAAGATADVATWQRAFEVNVMGHVHAAAKLIPIWSERGGGHLLVTASAAGLLTNLGDAPYSVTKHAAVAFAEWVSITHGHEGIGVTCLCPQGVRTSMVFGPQADEFAALRDGPDGSQPTGGDPDPARGGTTPPLEHDQAMAVQVVREQGVIEPAEAASTALEALRRGHFLALPHPEVARYEAHRASDHDRWINGMRKLQAQLDGRTVDGGT